MIPKFKPGEIAVIALTDLSSGFYKNMECTIHCLFMVAEGMPIYHIVPKEVGPDQQGRQIVCPEFALRKIRPDIEPGSWETCVWQPKTIRNRLTIEKIAALNQIKYEMTQSRLQQLKDRGYNIGSK